MNLIINIIINTNNQKRSPLAVLLITIVTIVTIVTIDTMTTNTSNVKVNALALSTSSNTKSPPRPPVWSNYKETLLSHGLLDLQHQRPIQMKAVNIGTSPGNSMRQDSHTDSDADADSNSDTHITTKIIHFQRHGQGYHNLLGDVIRASGNEINIDDPNPQNNPFVKAEIQDSPLTFQGRQEAESRRIQASMLSPQLIIVSPLQRALQTAMLSFADHIQHTNKGQQPVPFIAHEGCREQLGFLTCNKALPLSQTKADFPQVDFSLITHGEHDTLWHQYSQREHPVDEANRAYDFLTGFVMNRQETEIAIVCHSAWLFSVCNAVIDCGQDQELESWFETGEIRSLKVTFASKSN